MTPLSTPGQEPGTPGTGSAGGATAECHIWSLPPLPRPADWFRFLDSDELARCSAYLHELDLARFVTGRVLARSALGLLCGMEPESVRLRTRCPGCGGAHGKPQALGPAARWEFSITHSGDVVAVGVTEGLPIGLDVEQLLDPETPPESGMPPEHELVLTAEERATLLLLPREQRAPGFMTYWTRKEAVLKATGEGLNTPMHSFAVTGPDRAPALIGTAGGGEGRPDHGAGGPACRAQLVLADLDPGPGYRGAVAVLGAGAVRVRMRPGTELTAPRG
ncbi:4'-phosphopantetheinyl transferase family protein [Streptomyces sp. NBC_00388]|uniref:4'-phosphopantetheinyl transferase family protein n=1 Tax=Streptomyces sp. NBC_00388 TaxID=2975735 RepID=UPI002E1D61AD